MEPCLNPMLIKNDIYLVDNILSSFVISTERRDPGL
jgi:hypothetical protein